MMFGSTNAVGQPSSIPFDSPSVFGQTNNADSNHLDTKPFSRTNSYGSQAGVSVFCGTSTGSSVSGQKSAFGGFGSNTQTSLFGCTSQPSQPAFGSGSFSYRTPFSVASGSEFGTLNTSASAFATSTPAFGVETTPAFSASNDPVTGSGDGFGASSAPVSGSSSAPGSASGASIALSGHGVVSSTPAFGTLSRPSFGFSPSFGQTIVAPVSTQFGTSTPLFTSKISPFGNHWGSRYVPYSATATAETGNIFEPPKMLESMSAMPAYKDKSHEQLRWEDYQWGDKGSLRISCPVGPLPPGQPSTVNPFCQPITSAQTSANPCIHQYPPILCPLLVNLHLTLPSQPQISGQPHTLSQPSCNPFQSTSSAFISPRPPCPFANISNTWASTTSPSTGFSFGPIGSSSGQSTPLFGPTTPSFHQSNPFNTTGFSFASTQSGTSTNNQGLFGQLPPFPQPPPPSFGNDGKSQAGI